MVQGELRGEGRCPGRGVRSSASLPGSAPGFGPSRAADEYARAAATRPAETYARIVALDLVAGAEMLLKRGSIEQACSTWGQAMDHMDGVRSVRTRKAVRDMRGGLAAFRTRGLRCAAELDERAIDFLASV